MPILQRLTTEEVEALTKKDAVSARNEIAVAYDLLLAELTAGDHARVQLEEGESKVNVKNRIKAAAKRRGLECIVHRTKSETEVLFHLEAPELAEQAPSPTMRRNKNQHESVVLEDTVLA